MPAGEAGSPLTAIFCHGWLGNSLYSRRSLALAAKLRERGWAALLLNLPGHGRSSGATDKFTITQGKQAVRVAVGWLEKNIRPAKICLIGSSIGGSVSILAASSDKRISNLAVLAPRSDFKDTVPETYAFEYNGQNLINCSIRTSGLRIDFCRQAKKIKIPTLILHGSEDEFITPEQSENLFRALPVKRKKLAILKGCGHHLSGKFFEKSIIIILKWVTQNTKK